VDTVICAEHPAQIAQVVIDGFGGQAQMTGHHFCQACPPAGRRGRLVAKGSVAWRVSLKMMETL
jgi:hypothetical protein